MNNRDCIGDPNKLSSKERITESEELTNIFLGSYTRIVLLKPDVPIAPIIIFTCL